MSYCRRSAPDRAPTRSKEVLRIDGRARILTDAPFFDAMTLDDRRPALALVLEIDEIHLHCPQSLRRSGVWDPGSWPTG